MGGRLLCVYQHAPTPGAPGIYRHRQLFAELVRRGWSVDLVSTPRNYMTGLVPAEYAGMVARREEIDGIDHHWVWSSGRIHAGRRHRALNYASFATAAFARASLLPCPSVVMVSSPPLSVGSLGPALAARFRRPWILDVRDVWPESAVAVGWLTEESRLYRSMLREAERLAGGASAVTVQSPGLMPHVLRRGALNAAVLPGALIDAAPDAAVRASVRRRLGIDDTTCLFLYIGSIGVANAVDQLVDAVEALPTHLDAHLAVVGDGSARTSLEARVAGSDSGRTTFVGAVPKDEVRDYLWAADVCLHSLRPGGAFSYSFPSKILEYLGAHRPFVTTAVGFPELLARRSGGGFAPTHATLVEELVRWVEMGPAARRERGEAAHAWGTARFGLDHVVDRLEEILAAAQTGRQGLRRRRPACCPIGPVRERDADGR